MQASERPRVLPIPLVVLAAAWALHIWRNRTRAIGVIGVRPRAPLVNLRQILADHECVARAVGDVRQTEQAAEIHAVKHAVAAGMAGERAVRALVAPVGDEAATYAFQVVAPVGAADAFVVRLADGKAAQTAAIRQGPGVAEPVAGTEKHRHTAIGDTALPQGLRGNAAL